MQLKPPSSHHPFCPMTPRTYNLHKKSLCLVSPQQHMNARKVSGTFIPNALEFPDLFDEKMTLVNCATAGWPAMRGRMWVNVANDIVVLVTEGQCDWQLALNRSQEGNCHLALSLSVCLSRQLIFFPLSSHLNSLIRPLLFLLSTHFLAPISPPQPTLALQL